MSVVLRNAPRAITKLRAMNQAAVRAVAEGINDAAEEIFNESQRRVPVDTGNLRSSGRIEPADERTLTAEISYGGTAADYALDVHEAHATNSKYLEEPARQLAPNYKQHVTINIKRVTE